MGGAPKRVLDGKKNSDHIYSSDNIIKPNTIIEAKVVLLGDSGVGKSSIA